MTPDVPEDAERHMLGEGDEEWHLWADYERGMVGVRKEGRGPRLVPPGYARQVAEITELRFPDAPNAQAFCEELRRLADEVEP